jgi:alanine racemase
MSLLYATHARVHLGNIRDNLRAIRAAVGPARKVLVAVKANGYGHGAVEVSRMAEATGTAEWLGVATVPEGLELRAAGVGLPILKFGPTFPSAAPGRPSRSSTRPARPAGPRPST